MAVFAFIHAWSGQSGRGFVPQVGPASTAGAAAVPLAVVLAVVAPPALGAAVVAGVVGGADAEGAALAVAAGGAVALVDALGWGEGSGAAGDESTAPGSLSVFGHATRERPRTIIRAGNARMGGIVRGLPAVSASSSHRVSVVGCAAAK